MCTNATLKIYKRYRNRSCYKWFTVRLNFVRNGNTFITFNPHLELTGHHYLSPSLGYNSQLPICAPLFSFTCWGQAITNFFHKNFSFTWLLIQRSCDILEKDFHGFFRTYIDNTKVCHVNFARQFKSLPQDKTTIICCNPLTLRFIFKHLYYQVKLQEPSLDEFTMD